MAFIKPSKLRDKFGSSFVAKTNGDLTVDIYETLGSPEEAIFDGNYRIIHDISASRDEAIQAAKNRLMSRDWDGSDTTPDFDNDIDYSTHSLARNKVKLYVPQIVSVGQPIYILHDEGADIRVEISEIERRQFISHEEVSPYPPIAHWKDYDLLVAYQAKNAFSSIFFFQKDADLQSSLAYSTHGFWKSPTVCFSKAALGEAIEKVSLPRLRLAKSSVLWNQHMVATAERKIDQLEAIDLSAIPDLPVLETA